MTLQDFAGVGEEGPVKRLGGRLTRLERARKGQPDRCRACGHEGGRITLEEWKAGVFCECPRCGCAEMTRVRRHRRAAAEATLAEFEEAGA